MTMKEISAREKDKAGTPVTFVPANMLEQRKSEIQNMIARRAYEHFEHRGRVPGNEIEDWVQAETELLIYPCRHLPAAGAVERDTTLRGELAGRRCTDKRHRDAGQRVWALRLPADHGTVAGQRLVCRQGPSAANLA